MEIATGLCISLIVLLTAGMPARAIGDAPDKAVGDVDHVVVYHDRQTFAGWPANCGLWSWDNGREVLVGFVTGPLTSRQGHNIAPPFRNRMARSLDGGRTWVEENPPGTFQSGDAVPERQERVDFTAKNLALRFIGDGYHGGGPGDGLWNISADRGRTWHGAAGLPRLIPAQQASGRTQLTLRSDYIPLTADECLVMGSARSVRDAASERVFACRLVDGGTHARFLGWVNPENSSDRALMPATALAQPAVGGSLLTLFRVRDEQTGVGRIDSYRSVNIGLTWTVSGTVAETGGAGGNPPALLRLRDGRFLCAYGHRDRRAILSRVSSNEGRSWEPEVTLRSGCRPDNEGEVDLGYPRLFESHSGRAVVIYYWSSDTLPASHIAATIWQP